MYSMSFFALSTVWYNFQTFVMQNHVYFIAYIVSVGAISFAVTYRMVNIDQVTCKNLLPISFAIFVGSSGEPEDT